MNTRDIFKTQLVSDIFPKEIAILKHYQKDDKEFSGDYSSIEILFDNKITVIYGDFYHDKGQERSEAFIEGFLKAVDLIGADRPRIEHKKIADSEY